MIIMIINKIKWINSAHSILCLVDTFITDILSEFCVLYLQFILVVSTSIIIIFITHHNYHPLKHSFTFKIHSFHPQHLCLGSTFHTKHFPSSKIFSVHFFLLFTINLWKFFFHAVYEIGEEVLALSKQITWIHYCN